MGDTILTNLKKITHPNIIRRVASSGTNSIIFHNSKNLLSYSLSTKGDVFSILMVFHHHQEEYWFRLNKNYFDLMRRKISGPYQEYPAIGNIRVKIVAELNNIEYNNHESMIFQQSLLGDLGMFGVQEADMLNKIRNIYIGDKN